VQVLAPLLSGLLYAVGQQHPHLVAYLPAWLCCFGANIEATLGLRSVLTMCALAHASRFRPHQVMLSQRLLLRLASSLRSTWRLSLHSQVLPSALATGAQHRRLHD
jgi:hypothetical protein